MKTIKKAISNAFHYIKEAEEESNDLEERSKGIRLTEIRHLLGHVWYEVNVLKKSLPSEWVPGTGSDLPEGCLAYVMHPKHGVLHAYLEWFVETDSNGSHKWFTWTDYSKGLSVLASEVTHYIPIKLSLPEAPKMTTAMLYGKVWDILDEFGGAGPGGKEDFVNYMCRPDVQALDSIEYRFMGVFGAGGKIWQSDNRLYVSYYPEDDSEALNDRVDRINSLLSAIYPWLGVTSDDAEAASEVGRGENPTTP